MQTTMVLTVETPNHPERFQPGLKLPWRCQLFLRHTTWVITSSLVLYGSSQGDDEQHMVGSQDGNEEEFIGQRWRGNNWSDSTGQFLVCANYAATTSICTFKSNQYYSQSHQCVLLHFFLMLQPTTHISLSVPQTLGRIQWDLAQQNGEVLSSHWWCDLTT